MSRIKFLLFLLLLGSCPLRELPAQERGWGDTWRKPGSAGERAKQQRTAEIVREVAAKNYATAEKNLDAFVRQSPVDPGVRLWTARAHAAMHRYDAALRDCAEATRILKEDAPAAVGEALSVRAQVYAAMGNARASRADLERALGTNRKNVNYNNQLAWLLATSPDAAVRDGAQAVRYGKAANALSGGHVPAVLDTLAAAEAEAGDFEAAVRDERQALALGKGDKLHGGDKRLRLYENHQPYREDRPHETLSAE